MNSKIVGFILAPQKIDYRPLLNPNLKVEDIQVGVGVLSLYYYGNLNACCFNNCRYSMGFPASQSLLSNNLLITIGDQRVEIENDWLGSLPLFYNRSERIVSSFPTVCLTNNKQIDEEGLFLYLKYGFSVFGLTPFKEVQFALFNSKLTFTHSDINIVQTEDPIKRIDEFSGVSEAEIWSHVDRFMLDREQKTEGHIIIPTSGGFDSRVPNIFVHEKERVKTFTYGISRRQSNSFEVIEARKLANKLGHPWKQITLGQAFHYIPEWHDQFAFSTHLHGMYHVEFYKKIAAELGACEMSMCSGICGEFVTGSIPYNKLTSASGLYSLAWTHGINYRPDGWQTVSQAEKAFFETYSYLFDDMRFYPIANMRLKLILLHYTMTVPSMIGIPAWTPYLEFDLAMMMLNLPSHRRNKRQWVKDLCLEKGVLPKKSIFLHDTNNRLNHTFHLNRRYEPLKTEFQSPLITQERIDSINSVLGENSFSNNLNYTIMTTRFIKEIAKKFRFENKFEKSLIAYETLMALEMSLLKK